MKLLSLCLPLALLAGCDDECARSANPTECRQVVEAGGDSFDYLLYGMAGSMLGSTMSGGRKQTVLVPDPNYHGSRPLVNSYRNSPATVRARAVSVTTTRTDAAGRKVTTTRTRAWTGSGSSFRSSSSRSSFSSSSRRK